MNVLQFRTVISHGRKWGIRFYRCRPLGVIDVCVNFGQLAVRVSCLGVCAHFGRIPHNTEQVTSIDIDEIAKRSGWVRRPVKYEPQEETADKLHDDFVSMSMSPDEEKQKPDDPR